MKTLHRLSVLATLMATAAAPAFAQDTSSAIQSVTLYESGLAELTRATGGAQTVTLRVPMRDVNDILKSLLVRGAGVTGAKITMDGSDPVGDAFSRLPFPPQAVTNTLALFTAVPGLRVTINNNLTGVIVGVGEVCKEDAGCHMSLDILDDEGTITHAEINVGGSIKLLDAEIVEGITTGLASLRAAAGDTTRDITLVMTGDDVSDAQVSYVIAAPAWKTSYRAVTGINGSVNLQGWAVVENATGEDWSGIQMTLSSGSPVTLQSNLFGRDWRTREDVAYVQEEPVYALKSMSEDSMGGMDLQRLAAAPVAAISSGAVMSDSAVDSRFALPGEQNIPAGKILSVPFLTESIDATQLALWKGSLSTNTGNPDLILNIDNNLDVRLPAGIVTISEGKTGIVRASDPKTMFVGDASMPIVAPGEEVDIKYGTDRHIEISEKTSASTQQTSVTIANGMLQVNGFERSETTYKVTLHSGAGQAVTIDHPQIPEWKTTAYVDGATTLEMSEETTRGQNWDRFAMVLPADVLEATLIVTGERPTVQVRELSSMNRDVFLQWSGSVTTDAEKAFLDTAASLSGTISDLQASLTSIRETLAQKDADQARTRDNISAAGVGTSAHDRFMKTLIELEDEIVDGRRQEAELNTNLVSARSAFEDHLAAGI
jgi:hypothetical protein